jgi:protein-tyrosine-phosphatase
VCRSPYAAHRFQRLAEEAGDIELEVVSAGFIGPGRPPADMALAQALERGVDTTAYRSRVVEPAMLEDTDLVVLVDAAHGTRLRRALGRHGVPMVVLGDLDPEPVRRRTIRDPWGQDPAVYQRVFDRLDRCLGELAALLIDPDRARS